MKSKSYKDLYVWQKGMDLVVQVYELTADFPKVEVFGLTSQVRRCAVSIVANIAEGSKRGTKKDFRQFLLIAYGSGAELETYLEIIKRLGWSKGWDFTKICGTLDEVMRMLNKLTETLKTNN